MNGLSGFREVRSSPPDHHQIGCCTSNSLDSEQVPDSIPVSRNLSLVILVLGALLLWLPCSWAADPITPSGLLHTEIGPPILIGPTTQYDITGGTRPGGVSGTNLFHSFGDFSVPTNNIANFLNAGSVDLNGNVLDSNLPTSNILGTVTGVNPSIIFGMIQTNGPGGFANANLFLMNPHGFLFGPNATVNVGGMVSFTTANYLRLTDTGIFHADPAATSVLTSAPVAAFGFLGSNPTAPAAISIQGSTLAAQPGQTISLVGGNQGFNYTDPDTGDTGSAPGGVRMTGGKLSAPNGQINIVGVASIGEISAGDFMPTSGMTMGNIALSQGAILDVSGDGGGTVRIRGGQFVMDQSAVIANTTGANDGAPTAISINVTDGVSLDNHSALVTKATNAGRGGDIEITGRTIDVAGISNVRTESADSGSPGNIIVTASESISVRGTDQFGNPSEIFSDSTGLASTGSITLRSPLITLFEGAIETRMFGFGSGARAGNITIDATNLNLINGGMIRTTSGNDIAPTGNISITVGEAVNLAGTGKLDEISNITNENVSGGTGNILIQTGTLSLSDHARINSQTWFDADPAAANQAKISITADSTITLSTGSRIDIGGFFSDTGRLDVSANSLTISGASAITTLSNASGAAGPILMIVQDLAISEGSQVVSSSAQGFGRGGDITINATGSVLVTGQGTDPFGGAVTSGIFSNTMAGFEDPSFTGDAGNISITGHSIEVSNGARVDSSSQFFALGNAGNIDLLAPTITINGGTIATSTEFAGQAGTITLRADTVTLSNNGQLASNSIVREIPLFDGVVIPLPSGNAGNVTIQGLASPTQSVLIDGPGSGIFTNTEGIGAGGNIFVNADTVTLQNGGTLSAKTSGTEATATGGNITIHGSDVQFKTGAIVDADTSGAGHGGTIDIMATESLSLKDASSISSSSNSELENAGNAGEIRLNAPVIDVQTALVSASTVGPGNAGNIVLEANRVSLGTSETGQLHEQGADIFTRTTGPGQAGDITIRGRNGADSQAEIVTISGFSRMNSESFFGRTDVQGDAGNISIHTGSLTLSDGTLSTTSESSTGNAGTITIVASDEVTISSNGRLSSGAIEFASGNGGRIAVSAPTVVVERGGFISTNTDYIGNAGEIQIKANSVQLKTGGHISSSSIINQGAPDFTPSGSAGIITVQGLASPAQSVLIDGSGSGLFTDTQGTGAGGNIFLNANSVTLQNGGTLSAKTSGTEVTATGGTITVEGNTLQLNSGGTITAQSTGSGNAGNVTIQGLASPADSVVISGFDENFNPSGIFTDTQGTGAGGNITLNANTVTIQNVGTLLAATSGTNNGGDIQVNATAINLLTFASINTESFFSDGSAGNIALKATKQITAADSFLSSDLVGGTGLGGNILFRAPTISVNGGLLSTSTSGTGRAGNILLEGQQISLGASPLGGQQGADLFALTTGLGHGGTVTIRGPDGQSSHADNVNISGFSRFFTSTFSDGDAGDITINAAQFTLTSHATLNAESSGSGSAGTITTMATDSATISDFATLNTNTGTFGGTGNGGQITMSAPTVLIANRGSISTNTEGEGTGGNINILAGQSVTLTNSSRVSASSSGSGNAGNIDINAGQSFLARDSSVTTEANQASGGAIKITTDPSGTAQFIDSLISASVLDGTGGGGSVNIDPLYVLFQNSQMLAQAVQGPGGNITITITNGGLFLSDANSVISASSQFGVNGTVTIQSPNAPISGQIQPLGKTPLIATSLLNQHCASLAGGQFSSFTVAGRDSLPTEPGSWLSSPLAMLGTGMGEGLFGLSGLSSLSGVSDVVRGGLAAHQTDQIDKTDQKDQSVLSLRQIAPAGFLTQAFAVDRSVGCQS